MSPRSTRNARAAMATPALLLLLVTCLALAVAKLRGGGHNLLSHGGGVVRETEDDSRIIDDGEDDISIEHRHHHNHHGGKQHHDNHNGADSQGEAADNSYDNYVYSMSHQPEFCRENNEKFAGCQRFEEAWEGQLTIHGLWPNRNDGSWPSMCSNEKLDLSLLDDLSGELATRWPNVKSGPTAPDHASFWSHEWTKHGTCSGLTQHAYFSAALSLLLPTPSVVKENYGAAVQRKELEEGYHGPNGEDAVFVCKYGYLSEVRVCFGKNEGGAVGERVKCPDAVRMEDSCGEGAIEIAAFGAKGPTAVA